jgi:preprotein translocase subunit SecA
MESLFPLVDNLLPEAFAVARETAKRAIRLRPYEADLLVGV